MGRLMLCLLAMLGSCSLHAAQGPGATIDVNDRWRLDISAGLAFTNLTGANYVVGQETPGGDLVVLPGVNDAVNIVPATIVHIYPYSSSGVAAALSFGYAPDREDRYLFGVSAVFGYENHVTVTLGVAAGDVALLNGSQVGGPPPIEGPLTREVTRWGQFVALSVNVPIDLL